MYYLVCTHSVIIFTLSTSSCYFVLDLDRLITFLGVVGFAVGIFLSQTVFPSASIDLSVPRQRIFQQAEDYLQDIDTLDVEEYESVQQFNESWFSSVYLQRTLGVAETNELIETENLPIYFLEYAMVSAFCAGGVQSVAFYNRRSRRAIRIPFQSRSRVRI